MKRAAVLGLVFLAAVDALVAAGVAAAGLSGPSVALAAEHVGPAAAEMLPGLLSTILVGACLVLLVGAYRLVRGRRGAGLATAVGSGVSLAAVLPGLPGTQGAFAIFAVVFGSLILARAAEKAPIPADR